MNKQTNRIPPALKHGIYSGIGLLPTEDPVEFQKFKQEIFDDYKPVGRSEELIVEKIACLEWRSENLSTYAVAMRARRLHSSIFSELDLPSSKWALPMLVGFETKPDTRSPEELEALRETASRQARTELGPAVELVNIGDVATIEYLEKELAIRERLYAMIARLQKQLLYVRGVKTMSSSNATVSPQPLLGRAA